MNMTGLHINWTKPFSARRNDKYFIEDFELLTTMLSALKWKQKNGAIKLYADEIALDFYSSLKLLDMYDEIEVLNVDEDIDPKMFWAAGKLFALRQQKAPAAVIDTDFIVWEEILFDNIGDCTVIHFENLYPDVYQQKSYFNMSKDYVWEAFDWGLLACNTAFTVIKSQKLIEYYTETAIEFMKKAVKSDEPLKYMVFAEQRLINMCAKKLGIEVGAFSNLERLFRNGEKCFTHTWGMKQQMRDIPELRYDFCRRCTERIKRDFPRYGAIAGNIQKIL